MSTTAETGGKGEDGGAAVEGEATSNMSTGSAASSSASSLCSIEATDDEREEEEDGFGAGVDGDVVLNKTLEYKVDAIRHRCEAMAPCARIKKRIFSVSHLVPNKTLPSRLCDTRCVFFTSSSRRMQVC